MCPTVDAIGDTGFAVEPSAAMLQESEFASLVTMVFQDWRRHRLDFLVLRNYEGLPEVTTNDIDVLVAPRHLRRAEDSLLESAERCGFRLHNRGEFATLALYLSSKRSTCRVQAHFD